VTTALAKQDELDFGIDFSDMMMIVMMVIMMSLLTSMTSVAQSSAQTAQVMSAFTYEGKRYNKTMVVSGNELVWLTFDPPLVDVEIDNDGPDSVRWSIDTPENMIIIAAGSDDGADRISATSRIEVVFFKCLGGESAVVRISGLY